jgi:hypothetical protein
MKILVCGSRDWEGLWAENRVSAVLLALEILNNTISGEPPVFMHGGCPTGADAITDRWARRRDYEPQVYEANWAAYGKAAGPLRNSAMALAGADVCVAFNRGNSNGTIDMIMKAKKAGIWVIEVPWHPLKVGESVTPLVA